jgi:hypothetical protein
MSSGEGRAIVRGPQPGAYHRQAVGATSTTNLADLLERVLDKGVVIAGDITLCLGSVEVLTLRIRLLIASLDKAQEVGIDWWRSDPFLSSRAKALEQEREQREELEERLERLEERLALQTQAASAVEPPEAGKRKATRDSKSRDAKRNGKKPKATRDA